MKFFVTNKQGTIETFIETDQIEYVKATLGVTVQCFVSLKSGKSVNVNLSPEHYQTFKSHLVSEFYVGSAIGGVVNYDDTGTGIKEPNENTIDSLMSDVITTKQEEV